MNSYDRRAGVGGLLRGRRRRSQAMWVRWSCLTTRNQRYAQTTKSLLYLASLNARAIVPIPKIQTVNIRALVPIPLLQTINTMAILLLALLQRAEILVSWINWPPHYILISYHILNFNLYMVRCIGRSECAGGLNGIKYCVLQNTLKYHKIKNINYHEINDFCNKCSNINFCQ